MPLMIRCKALGSRTPPRTPPSEPAKDTLKLPVLWQLPENLVSSSFSSLSLSQVSHPNIIIPTKNSLESFLSKKQTKALLLITENIPPPCISSHSLGISKKISLSHTLLLLKRHPPGSCSWPATPHCSCSAAQITACKIPPASSHRCRLLIAPQKAITDSVAAN